MHSYWQIWIVKVNASYTHSYMILFIHLCALFYNGYYWLMLVANCLDILGVLLTLEFHPSLQISYLIWIKNIKSHNYEGYFKKIHVNHVDNLPLKQSSLICHNNQLIITSWPGLDLRVFLYLLTQSWVLFQVWNWSVFSITGLVNAFTIGMGEILKSELQLELYSSLTFLLEDGVVASRTVSPALENWTLKFLLRNAFLWFETFSEVRKSSSPLL